MVRTTIIHIFCKNAQRLKRYVTPKGITLLKNKKKRTKDINNNNTYLVHLT